MGAVSTYFQRADWSVVGWLLTGFDLTLWGRAAAGYRGDLPRLKVSQLRDTSKNQSSAQRWRANPPVSLHNTGLWETVEWSHWRCSGGSWRSNTFHFFLPGCIHHFHICHYHCFFNVSNTQIDFLDALKRFLVQDESFFTSRPQLFHTALLCLQPWSVCQYLVAAFQTRSHLQPTVRNPLQTPD